MCNRGGGGRLGRTGLSVENMPRARHAGGRQAVEARQSPLVLVGGPLADKASRDPAFILKLGDFAQLLLLARTDPGMSRSPLD